MLVLPLASAPMEHETDVAREQQPASGGQGGLAVGVGLTLAILFALLPVLIVPTFYLLANVVALLEGRGFSAATMNVGALFVGLVAIVTVLVLVTVLAANAAGRALSPRRRRSTAGET